ncbi:MAG: hypothetical protein ACKVU1_08295, partial [bacterium]
ARFQPMNINIGLFPPLPAGRRARDVRDAMIAERARTSLDAWIESGFAPVDLVAAPGPSCAESISDAPAPLGVAPATTEAEA